MEQQLLQEMVVERDVKIEDLNQTLTHQDQLLVKVQDELDEIRLQSTEQTIHNLREIRIAEEALKSVQHRMATVQGEMTRVGSLSVYRACLASELSKNENEARVLRMQAQLCKAMHFINILRNELLLLKKKADEQIKVLKDVITSITDEKCKMEMSIMNQLMEVDGKRRDMEKDYSSLLETINLTYLELKESTHSRSREKMLEVKENDDESQQDSDEDSDSDDDSEDEEIEVLDREERRKLFEKRKEDLMRKRAALSRHYVTEDRKQ